MSKSNNIQVAIYARVSSCNQDHTSLATQFTSVIRSLHPFHGLLGNGELALRVVYYSRKSSA